MRTAAIVVGIIGGIFSLLYVGVFGFLFGGIVSIASSDTGSAIKVLVIALPVLALVGAGLCSTRASIGGFLLLLSAAGHIWLIGPSLGLLFAIPLGTAGMLGIAAGTSERSVRKTNGAPSQACDACGRSNGSDAKFCVGCGAPVGQAASCGACGQATVAGARFCASCGASVGGPSENVWSDERIKAPSIGKQISEQLERLLPGRNKFVALAAFAVLIAIVGLVAWRSYTRSQDEARVAGDYVCNNARGLATLSLHSGHADETYLPGVIPAGWIVPVPWYKIEGDQLSLSPGQFRPSLFRILDGKFFSDGRTRLEAIGDPGTNGECVRQY